MKKILFFTAVILSLFIINNLLRSIYLTWQKQTFLLQAERSVTQEQEKHQQLELQLKKVSQQAFVEEQARDQLLLVKPGEQLVIIPSGLIQPSAKATQTPSIKPHWQEWLEYFDH